MDSRRGDSCRSAGLNRALQAGLFALAAVGTVFYVVRLWTVYAAGELLHRLGSDWTMFWAQAMLVRSGRASEMYEYDPVNNQLQVLAHYYAGPGRFQTATPVAYPPWFAALFIPFTVPPAPIGFVLWSALSVACALFLVMRVRQMLPSLPLLGAFVLVFGAFPVALGLFMGQVALFIALAVSEMLMSFRAGRDFRAGLWLSVLLLKPQYALLFGLIILWKWRPRALVGTALGALAFFSLGLAVAGSAAFFRISEALGDLADFRSEAAAPLLMVNWRAFVLYATPWIDNDRGALLATSLSAASVVLLLYLWRGPWNASAPEFSLRFAALALGAVATSWHSHVHGIALAMVPLAAAWAQPAVTMRTRLGIATAAYLPTLLLIYAGGVVDRFAVPYATDVSLWYVWPDGLPVLTFLAAFVLVCRDLWRLDRPSLSTVLAFWPRVRRSYAR